MAQQTQLFDVYRKGILSMVLLILVVSAFVIDTSSMIDQRADKHLEQVWERSLYTFGVARGLNAITSVLQGTNVTVSLLGTAGTTVAIGQLVDPIDDIIEVFSYAMLASSASVGLQRVGLTIGSWLGAKLLFPIGAMIVIAWMWWFPHSPSVGKVGLRILLIALLIRFCFPMVAWVSSWTYDRFLQKHYQESITTMETAEKDLSGLLQEEKPAGESTGFLDKLKETYEKATNFSGMKRKILMIQKALGDYSRFVIDLMVVFFIQTLLIPLGVLWGMRFMGGYLVGMINPMKK